MRSSRAFARALGIAAIVTTALLAGLLSSGPAGGAVFVAPAAKAVALAAAAPSGAREVAPPKPKTIKKTDEASAEAAKTSARAESQGGDAASGKAPAQTADRAPARTSGKSPPQSSAQATGQTSGKAPAKASVKAAAAASGQSGSTTPSAASSPSAELEKAIRDFSALADDGSSKREAWTALESRFQKLSSSHSSAVAAKALFYAGRVREQVAERARPGAADAKDDVRKACAAYSELVRRFPQSGLADDALFRKGSLQADPLGDGAAARKTMEFLLDEYPSGDMSAPAKSFLAEQDKAAKAAQKARAALPAPPAPAVSSATGALRAPVAPSPDAKGAGKAGPAQATAQSASQSTGQTTPQSTAQSTVQGTAQAQPASKQAAKQAPQEQAPAKSASASQPAKTASADASETAMASGPDDVDDAKRPAAKPSLTAPVRSVTGLRVQNSKDFARIILDLDGKAEFACERQDSPDAKAGRLAVTFGRLKLSPKVKASPAVGQGLLKKATMAADAKSRSSLVLDAASLGRFKAYSVEDPYRVFIDVFPAGPETADAAQGADAKVGPDGKLSAKVEVKPSARKQSANLVEQLGLTVHTIMIDPGHGGKDPGAMAHGLQEKDVNLRMAFLLGAALKAKGFEVLYTRQKDVFIPLEDRPVMANKRKADMFVSIHCNSAPDASASGLETYTLNLAKTADASRVAARENAASAKTISDLQFILADLMLSSKKKESDDLARCVQSEVIRCARKASYPLRDHGAKEAPFYVLMGARMPAVLVELGYITNKDESERMRSDAYLKSLAAGLTEGIVAYKNKIERFASL